MAFRDNNNNNYMSNYKEEENRWFSLDMVIMAILKYISSF